MKASISQKVGILLQIWRIIQEESAVALQETMHFESLGCNFSNNQAVTFLMTEIDPECPTWGFSSISPFADIGNVIAMREDEKDITVGDVVDICEFSQHIMRPKFEEALEATCFEDRTRLLAAIDSLLTPEYFNVFQEERRNGGTSFSG